jgi:DNA repair photolyase
LKVVEVPCQQALSPSLLAGYDWALNPYRGCAFDCLYCYAPDVVRIEREQWAQTLYVKRSAPAALAKEVKRKARGVVGLSTVTDPYQPAERKLEVTRRCIEVLCKAKWPVSVLTKSPLVTRDLDLLARMPGSEVGFSISTGDDRERERWERRCPPVEDRFEALAKVAAAGVRAYVFAGPLFPESSPEAMRKLAALARGAGASEVMADTLHSRPGGLDRVLRATSPLAPGQWDAASEALLKELGAACEENGVPFTLARNWKPRGSGQGQQHLVSAGAAIEQAAVVQQPREVTGLRAPLADALALGRRLEQFD